MQNGNSSKPVFSDGEVFTRKGTIMGYSQFDGDGEYNASYGVHMLVTLKPPLGKGQRTEVRPCVDKAVLERIDHLTFPFEAEVSMVELASKKATALTVIDVKPLSLVKKAA